MDKDDYLAEYSKSSCVSEKSTKSKNFEDNYGCEHYKRKSKFVVS